MGTSGVKSARLQNREDHPHAYGDKSVYDALAIGQLGSSPRVWGQVFMLIRTAYTVRIIPTRMGTSKLTITLADIL